MFPKAFHLVFTLLLALAPRAVERDARWDDRFGAPGEASSNVPINGVNGRVHAIEVVGTNVYVAGSFSRAGNIQANNIARWDGSQWHALGEGENNGVRGEVNALESGFDGLSVGGLFDRAGAVEVSNLATWKEESGWEILGGRVNGRVRALLKPRSSTLLHVGGDFTAVDGAPFAHVVRVENDFSLIGMDGGVNGPVHAIAASDREYWFGGEFTQAGGRTARHIALWQPFESENGRWTLVPGVNGFVYALHASATNVFVGGNFTETTDGVPSRSLALLELERFRFIPIDGELYGPMPIVVNAIWADDSGLYVGGHFRGVNGSRSSAALVGNVAVRHWNGIWANPFGAGVNGDVYALRYHRNRLLIGGAFDDANGQPVENIAVLRNTEVEVLRGGGTVAQAPGAGGMGLDNRVLALAGAGPYVYAGGGFTNAGGVIAERVARWDGSRWAPLGGITYGHVHAVLPVEGGLYAAGEFSDAGGPVENIAFWNGAKWSALGPVATNVVETPFGVITSYEINGPEGTVRAMTMIGSDLYVVGSFGGVGKSVAKWNGTTWTNLAEGSSSAGGSHDPGGGLRPEGLGNMTEFGVSSADCYAAVGLNGQLYVGGLFNRAGTNVVNNVARWDGEHWHAVGAGFDGEVFAMATDGTRIFAAGNSAREAGESARNVAVWDGATWTRMPGDFDGPVNAMTLRGNHIYVTGAFTNVAGVKMSGVARWDGAKWNALGSGLEYEFGAAGRAILAREDGLYVGGDFQVAGGKPSFHFARWSLAAADAAEWRTIYFGAEEQALSGEGADPDGDGMSNAEEFAAGTNPRSAESVFALEPVVTGSGAVTVTFVAEANRSYTVQYADAVATPTTWQRLADVSARGLRRTETVSDPSASGAVRIYRVITPALP